MSDKDGQSSDCYSGSKQLGLATPRTSVAQHRALLEVPLHTAAFRRSIAGSADTNVVTAIAKDVTKMKMYVACCLSWSMKSEVFVLSLM